MFWCSGLDRRLYGNGNQGVNGLECDGSEIQGGDQGRLADQLDDDDCVIDEDRGKALEHGRGNQGGLNRKKQSSLEVCPAFPPLFSQNIFTKDSKNQYKLQAELLKRWRGNPLLGYIEQPVLESKVVASALEDRPPKKNQGIYF